MRTRSRLLCALALCTACSRSMDPCPPGSTLQDDRCTPLSDAGRGGSPNHRLDASVPLDGSSSAGDGSALHDAQPSPRDASETEAGPSDAGADGALAQHCSRTDLMRWSALHASTALVSTINDCILRSPACLSGSCELDVCLRARLDLRGCVTCTREEVACVATYCRDECGLSASSDECRACLCESGCAELFEACSGAELGICPQVVPVPELPDAGPPPLAPELIMTIIGSAL